MSIFAVSSLLTAILTVALGSLVWLKNPRRELNKSWWLVSLSVFLWTLGLFGASTTSSALIALFWQRILWTAPMHIVTVLIILFSGLAGKKRIILGLAGAIILHLLFNISV